MKNLLEIIKLYKLVIFSIFLFLWVGTVGIAVLIISISKAESKPPVQPINFSHKIHVSQLEIDCINCHEFVDRSPVAGAPAIEICMQCHEAVATDKPQIISLRKYWEEKRPIEWVRVYSIPEAVYFTHKRHVKAGIDCKVCHGDVANMSMMRRVRKLKMGWCINCHRKENAPTDCITCHK